MTTWEKVNSVSTLDELREYVEDELDFLKGYLVEREGFESDENIIEGQIIFANKILQLLTSEDLEPQSKEASASVPGKELTPIKAKVLPTEIRPPFYVEELPDE
jgi:hypothetical protein